MNASTEPNGVLKGAPNNMVLRRLRQAAAAAALSPLAAHAADQVSAQLDSSVSVAFQPWESPTISWIFLMASGTMSIALVVWGRNGL